MKRVIPVAAGVLWIAATIAGVGALWQYAHRPGVDSLAPNLWPSAVSRNLLTTDRPTLLMFFHPECPCSEATLSELARVLTHARGQISARVYIYDSAGLERPAADGPIWQSAARIPGVQVLADRDGRMARTFGAETSGASLLYDPNGRLLFEGGITGARGHEGENASEDALLTCLEKRPTASIRTHTYGCPIF